jgi:C1A family cysteine protease
MTPRAYGWKPDLPNRYPRFADIHHPGIAVLPSKVSLLDRMPPVFDQGQLASCTANALLGAMGFLHPGFIGSRLALYYAERLIEGTVESDAGAAISDGVRVLMEQGVAPEADWPYDTSRFAHAPPAKALADAAAHRVSSASKLEPSDFKQCLAAGFPFVIGFTVRSSFESARVAATGIVPLPDYDEPVLGGHAVLVAGYDENSPAGSAYLVRNSWGAWGWKGNCWMPCAALEHADLASDSWTLRA